MAGTPVVDLTGRIGRRGKGGHMLTITGRLGLSANSIFSAEPIERYFRRCTNIDINIGTAFLVQYQGSRTVNNYGLMRIFGASNFSAIGTVSGLIAGKAGIVSGTFTATGF